MYATVHVWRPENKFEKPVFSFLSWPDFKLKSFGILSAPGWVLRIRETRVRWNRTERTLGKQSGSVWKHTKGAPGQCIQGSLRTPSWKVKASKGRSQSEPDCGESSELTLKTRNTVVKLEKTATSLQGRLGQLKVCKRGWCGGVWISKGWTVTWWSRGVRMGPAAVQRAQAEWGVERSKWWQIGQQAEATGLCLWTLLVTSEQMLSMTRAWGTKEKVLLAFKMESSKPAVVAQAVIPALRRWTRKDQDFKAIPYTYGVRRHLLSSSILISFPLVEFDFCLILDLRTISFSLAFLPPWGRSCFSH